MIEKHILGPSIVSVTIAVVCAFLPGIVPFWVLVAQVPLMAALAALLDADWMFDEDPDTPVAAPTMWVPPLVVLAFRAAQNGRSLATAWPTLAASGLAAAVVTLVIVLVFRRETNLRDVARISVTGTFALAMIYCFCVAVSVNVVQDRLQVTVFQTAVVDKETGSSKGRYYHLYVKPWGPFKKPIWHTESDIYDRTQIGDPACGYLHRGALGWAYGETSSCPAA